MGHISTSNNLTTSGAVKTKYVYKAVEKASRATFKGQCTFWDPGQEPIVSVLDCKVLRHQKKKYVDFPGGPVVRTPRFHCRGHGFDPGSGN